MSYLRSGHPLIYFEGFSKAYVFHSCGESGAEDFVEDYDNKYEDNATFAELLVNFILKETNDKKYAWKIAGILEKKLPDVKRRKKPLGSGQYDALLDKEMKRFRKEEGKKFFDKLKETKPRKQK